MAEMLAANLGGCWVGRQAAYGLSSAKRAPQIAWSANVERPLPMSWKQHAPKHGGDYFSLDVETYYPDQTSGKHGPIHVRPLPGQGYDGWMVQCSRKLCTEYPVGTRFRLRATTTDNHRKGGLYLTSWFGWPFEVLGPPKNIS